MDLYHKHMVYHVLELKHVSFQHIQQSPIIFFHYEYFDIHSISLCFVQLQAHSYIYKTHNSFSRLLPSSVWQNSH